MSETEGLPASRRRVVLPAGRSLLVHERGFLMVLAVLAATGAVVVLTLLTGIYDLHPVAALRVLGGGGGNLDQFFVLEQRLPRAVAAVLVGAMLGLSGAVFQSLSRNPLGSPDIVGFTAGATTGGLVVILASAASSSGLIAMGTTLGGFATAGVVVLVAARRTAGGDSLILAGIALSQMLSALNDYLLSRASFEDAESAKAWKFGSLNAITWPQVVPLALGALVLLPLVIWLARPAQLLEMGDESAVSLGLRIGRLRAALLGYGVLLASLCVATCGPIGFLALAAPQIARRLTRSSGIAMTASAAMGSFLLSGADLIGGRLLAPFQIPVGLVSAACGGLYLMWFLGLRRQKE